MKIWMKRQLRHLWILILPLVSPTQSSLSPKTSWGNKVPAISRDFKIWADSNHSASRTDVLDSSFPPQVPKRVTSGCLNQKEHFWSRFVNNWSLILKIHHGCRLILYSGRWLGWGMTLCWEESLYSKWWAISHPFFSVKGLTGAICFFSFTLHVCSWVSLSKAYALGRRQGS